MNANLYHGVTRDQNNVLLAVRELLNRDQPVMALTLLNNYHGHEVTPLRIARGVCLLRMGLAEEAKDLFRALCYPNDAFEIPDDTPTEVRVDYISAMLLMGNVLVGASLLYHVPERDHPAVRRLRAGIRAWKRSLPWWGRVLVLLGFYPESAPSLGRSVGRLWLPPVTDKPTVGKRAA